MSDQTEPLDAVRSADQRDVESYFGSERFRRRRTLSPEASTDRLLAPGPFRTWGIDEGAPSLLAGVAGLSAITTFFAVMFPIGLEAMQEFTRTRPQYPVMMMIVQTLYFPAMVSFCFAAVCPMFWYGSLIVRFLMAAAAVLPGCIAFLIGISLVEGAPPNDFWEGFAVVMFTAFLAIAATSLTIQMWTRWSLSHARVDEAALPPLGTRAMIELTSIAAIGFAVFVSTDTDEYLVGMYFFGGVGFLASATIIAAMIAYFRAGRKRSIAVGAGVAFAFAIAFFVNSFFAAQEYGWDILSVEAVLIGLISAYGTFVIFLVVWLCLRWLRYCGWRCVNRRLEQELAAQRDAGTI